LLPAFKKPPAGFEIVQPTLKAQEHELHDKIKETNKNNKRPSNQLAKIAEEQETGQEEETDEDTDDNEEDLQISWDDKQQSTKDIG
jgi:hypothetical protein